MTDLKIIITYTGSLKDSRVITASDGYHVQFQLSRDLPDSWVDYTDVNRGQRPKLFGTLRSAKAEAMRIAKVAPDQCKHTRRTGSITVHRCKRPAVKDGFCTIHQHDYLSPKEKMEAEKWL